MYFEVPCVLLRMLQVVSMFAPFSCTTRESSGSLYECCMLPICIQLRAQSLSRQVFFGEKEFLLVMFH